MCNACGFYCCAHDGFARCGCEGCPNPACWPDDADDHDPDDDNGFLCSPVIDVGDELHQILGDALRAAALKTA